MAKKSSKNTLAIILVLLAITAVAYLYWAEIRKPPDPATQGHGPEALVELPKYEGKARPAIGMNANEIHHEDASIPFVDLFRLADPFKDNPSGLSSEDVEYNEQGWPIRLNGGKAGTKFIGKLPPEALPTDEFIVLYEGDGTIEYGHDVKVVEQQIGRHIIRIPAGEDGELNASVLITVTNEKNPIRNVRILPKGGICKNDPYTYVKDDSGCSITTKFLPFEFYYNSIVFNPDYLAYMKDFKVIRFMPMSGITRNPVSEWSERPQMDELSWGGGYGERGAPLEIQIDLANRLKADAWFNLPHAATDEYVINSAKMIKEKLDPSLRAFVEYTNEAWNTNFSHSEYTQKKGIEAGYSNNAVEAGEEYYVVRSLEVFKLWDEVFADQKDRLVRILGSWDTRPKLTRRLLMLHDAYKHVDAVAIAPYFGGNLKEFRETDSLDEIFRLSEEEGSYRSLKETIKHIKEQVKVTSALGVELMAYEGGQSLVDWSTRSSEQHPNPLFFAANRDQRMGTLYAEMLEGWRDAGAGLFVMFSAPRTCQWFGCWGLKEHIRQARKDAPKYSATMDFIEKYPDWRKHAQEHIQAKPTDDKIDSIKKHLAAEDRPRKPDDPVIVWRPTFGKEDRYFFLENPRTLDTLIKGDTWVKKDLFGKWQGKWDEQFIYLTVRIYDEAVVADSPSDPLNDDSIEFFIDADNSRGTTYDGKDDFHFIFVWDKKEVIFSDNSPMSVRSAKAVHEDFSFEWEKREDGYELRAHIPWKMLGIDKPYVSQRLGIEVQVNDDDDGGEREQKISWIARKEGADKDPSLFGVVLISGR